MYHNSLANIGIKKEEEVNKINENRLYMTAIQFIILYLQFE